MYAVFAILLAAGLLILTICGIKGKAWTKHINLGLSALGLVGIIAVPLVTRELIFGSDQTEEWMSWGWDAFVLYLKTSLPFVVASLALICLSMLAAETAARVHLKKGGMFTQTISAAVRQAVSLATSYLFLFLAPFYSVMAQTDGAAIHVMILLFGISETLLMRFTFVLDQLWKRNGKP